MSNNHKDDSTVLSHDETVVKQALKQQLDAEVDSLDFNVTSKLAAARSRALAQETTRPAWHNLFGLQNLFNWQIMAGGLAAVVVAFVVSGQFFMPDLETPTVAEQTSNVLMEDMTILANSDDLEFYQNIEFLEWLESNS